MYLGRLVGEEGAAGSFEEAVSMLCTESADFGSCKVDASYPLGDARARITVTTSTTRASAAAIVTSAGTPVAAALGNCPVEYASHKVGPMNAA